ncbi:MAG: nucleotidyltransferase family protein, partial [Deltaproteobacteria bacterium]|nr:nucleotidyltransferase family protein [Deltaproteobacteria bacterium]
MVAWQDLIKFIQCVSRTQLRQTDVDHVFRFAKKEVPWDHLVVLAGIEGVDGFVYYHMNRLGLLNSLPKSVLPKLEDSYARTRKRTLAILNEAEVLSTRLEKARIPVIALQGLPLIKTLYQDPGLRQLGDMDLMVKPGDKDRLKELLCQAGFCTPYPNYPDILFKSDVLIDIHTHVLNLDRIKSRRYLFPEDLGPMWERAIPLFGQADGLLILDPCDNFIALAAHALKH